MFLSVEESLDAQPASKTNVSTLDHAASKPGCRERFGIVRRVCRVKVRNVRASIATGSRRSAVITIKLSRRGQHFVSR